MKAETETAQKKEESKENGSGKERGNDAIGHKRNGSDVIRVFRRENSDFFVPSVRHSAVFLESKNLRQNPFNSSTRRGSDVAGLSGRYSSPKPSEPVLTDFNLGGGGGNSSGIGSSGGGGGANNSGGDWQPVRPRRERTEGDIILQKSRQELRDSLEARRIDVEMRFSREAEKMRKRNTRPVTEADVGNSTSSSDERQVSRVKSTSGLYVLVVSNSIIIWFIHFNIDLINFLNLNSF